MTDTLPCLVQHRNQTGEHSELVRKTQNKKPRTRKEQWCSTAAVGPKEIGSRVAGSGTPGVCLLLSGVSDAGRLRG